LSSREAGYVAAHLLKDSRHLGMDGVRHDCVGASAGCAEVRNLKPSAVRSGKPLRRGGTTDVSRADKKYVQNETPRLDRTPVTTGSALDHAPTVISIRPWCHGDYKFKSHHGWYSAGWSAFRLDLTQAISEPARTEPRWFGFRSANRGSRRSQPPLTIQAASRTPRKGHRHTLRRDCRRRPGIPAQTSVTSPGHPVSLCLYCRKSNLPAA